MSKQQPHLKPAKLTNATLRHTRSKEQRYFSSLTHRTLPSELHQNRRATSDCHLQHFFLKKLSDTQKKYSTYDRELLAIYESIKYFKDILQGRIVTIRTHHKQLIHAFRQRLNKASPRQARQLDLIVQFITNIIHIAGQENIVSDILSRIYQVPVITTTEELFTEQAKDEELQELLKGESALELKEFTLLSSTTPFYCDCSKDAIRFQEL